MRGVNMAVLVGNLGNDPEVKYLQDGTAVCSLSVATTEKWKDKSTGEEKERTEWHRVQVFGKAGEACGEYLRKGAGVYVQGTIRYRKHTGQDGVEKYYTDIRVDMNGVVRFLDRAPSGDRPERTERPAPAQRRVPAQAAAARQEVGEDFADDDIPF